MRWVASPSALLLLRVASALGVDCTGHKAAAAEDGRPQAIVNERDAHQHHLTLVSLYCTVLCRGAG
jgi:hypothetical protein